MKERQYNADDNVSKKRVHGVDVTTFSKEIVGINCIKVEVGTTINF